jgi:hypothetical protein
MSGLNARMVEEMQVKNRDTLDFYEPPKYAGEWVIGGNFHISIREKPTDEQIKNTEQMFGWKWKDEA